MAKTETKPSLPNLTSAEIREAEAELLKGGQPLESTTPDRLAALLTIWAEFESNRLRIEEQYRLTLELPGAAKDGLVENYARTRKALGLVETRMVEVFRCSPGMEVLLKSPFRTSEGAAQFPGHLAERIEAILTKEV